jgi:hypothetical protein
MAAVWLTMHAPAGSVMVDIRIFSVSPRRSAAAQQTLPSCAAHHDMRHDSIWHWVAGLETQSVAGNVQSNIKTQHINLSLSLTLCMQ